VGFLFRILPGEGHQQTGEQEVEVGELDREQARLGTERRATT
jgi:hypothetical protein